MSTDTVEIPIDAKLYRRLEKRAKKEGMTPDALVTKWIKEETRKLARRRKHHEHS